MPKTFSISGQHYLFDVQTFAQVVLGAGGDEYHYALYDRTTQGVIDDVVSRTSDLGVYCQTTLTAGPNRPGARPRRARVPRARTKRSAHRASQEPPDGEPFQH